MAAARRRGSRPISEWYAMMPRFMGLLNGLVAILQVLTAVLLIVAVALNFANIIGRYMFNAPIASAEEVMLFLLVAVVFLGNGLVSWEGKQIRMDVIVHALPPTVRRILEVFADLTMMVVSIMLIVFAWPVIDMLYDFDQRSPAAGVPLFIPQALIPVGLGLMIFLTAARLIKSGIRRRADAAVD
jgi:TRAP-type C4-dicarboxylate transport system permease small subunit